MEEIVNSKNNFWKNKKVFITGVEGFIGSHVAITLIKKGAMIVGLVRDTIPMNNLKLSGYDSSIIKVFGELQNYELLKRIICEYKIEYVFHLGAQAIVSVAYLSPLSTFESNIKGTWCLLEACRSSNFIKGVLVASSDKAYGSHKTLPYTENFSLMPIYPYDVSKACTDLIARSYAHTYKLPIVILRSANTYGPGDLNLSRIVPDTISSILHNNDPVMRSDGTPLRDMIYITDVATAYLTVAESIQNKNVMGQAFNIGTNSPMTVLEIVRKIIKVSKYKSIQPKVLGNDISKHEISNQYLNSKKISDLTGWKPKISFDRGLNDTWNWWNCHWKELKKLCN